MNQRERVLKYIEKRGSITGLEAVTELGVMKLSNRISEMLAAGVPIVKEWVDVENRFGEPCRVVRYRL